MCDSVPRRRRRPRHSHCRLLSRARLLRLVLARAHDSVRDSVRVCHHARLLHARVQAEHQDDRDCGSYSGPTATLL